MGTLLALLTGGRPMKRLGCAFIDKVSGREVFEFEDRCGRYWLAEKPWSWFRVGIPYPVHSRILSGLSPALGKEG
jgi:hypothetical protein